MLNISIDGACSSNGKPDARAGWGFVVESGESFSGPVPGKQTNNRAELMALLKALEWLLNNHNQESYSEVLVYSDSEILVNGVYGYAKRKANRDLWSSIEDHIYEVKEKGIALTIEYIPRSQNKADKVAKAATKSLI